MVGAQRQLILDSRHIWRAAAGQPQSEELWGLPGCPQRGNPDFSSNFRNHIFRPLQEQGWLVLATGVNPAGRQNDPDCPGGILTNSAYPGLAWFGAERDRQDFASSID